MNYVIVADESVDYRIITRLIEIGITVYAIAKESPSITDSQVLSVAVEKKALLITEDKDFGELVFRLQLSHYGILLIRMDEADYKIDSVAAAILRHYKDLINRFSVINNQKLRIKEL